jgi:glycosyltransferase involved in cell wall biosynthesis
MKKKESLVIVPAFNEALTITTLITDLRKNDFKNILVVDDGSTDKTSEIAQKLGVIVLKHLKNCGVGAATKTGFDWGLKNGFEFLGTIDGDTQHQASDLKKVFEECKTHQCIFGSRFLEKNKIPFWRRVFNKIANVTTGLLFGIWISDSQSGLRGFSRNVVEKLNVKADGFEFCSALVRELYAKGFKIHEIPISIKYSKYSLKKGQNFSTGCKTFGKLLMETFFRKI